MAVHNGRWCSPRHHMVGNSVLDSVLKSENKLHFLPG